MYPPSQIGTYPLGYPFTYPYYPAPATSPLNFLQRPFSPRDVGAHMPPSFGSHLPHHFPLHILPHRRATEVKMEKDTYKVAVDVQDFSPDELVVTAVANWLVIEGCHEEKSDEHGHGTISRTFRRKWQILSDVDADSFDEKLTCEMGKDGYLVVTLPRKCGSGKGMGKVIPIKTNKDNQ